MISVEEFMALDAVERVRAVDEVHGSKALLLSSMQKSAGVLMHMIHRTGAKTVILFVDTQFHFPETLEVRDQFIDKYSLEITTVYPELTPEKQRRKYGKDLYNYVDGQPECCEMRKEKPFLRAARRMRIEATLAGLMKIEGRTRGDAKPIEYDPRLNARVFHPLFDWNYEMLDDYTKRHDLPMHALYAQSYLSIGCDVCTTPVAPGEDRRAGRWRHLRAEDGTQPEYCGINFTDMGTGI